MCSIFKNPATVHVDNKGESTLVVNPKVQPRTKHTAIKYNCFRSFAANGDVEIQYIDTKEHIANILQSC